MPEPTYRVVALGGTFDVLHIGHEELLAKSFELGEKVIIGVASDKLVQTIGKRHPVRPYNLRVRDIRRFLRKRGWVGRARISPLRDPYGPAAARKNLQALVVTPNTLASGKRLNQIRRRKGLRPLVIAKVRLARAQDGKPVSSTRIRNGEIDRYGRILRSG